MKRLIAIFFTSLIGLNGGLLYLYSGLELLRLKRDARIQVRQLPAERLEMLTMSQAEYESSIVEEGEIRWNGNMYDVARVHRLGGVVVVFCLRDEREEGMLAFISELFSSPVDQQNIPPAVFGYLSTPFISTSNIPEFLLTETPVIHATAYLVLIPGPGKPADTPPPKA